MVADEGGRDAPDVAEKVEQHGAERPQLENGDRRRNQRRVAAVYSCEAAGKDEMRRGTDGNELGKALDDAKNDRLY